MKKSLIFETLGSINEMKVEKSDKKGELMTLSGVFGVCGIVNNNNRVYEKSNYEAMVNQMKEIIKSEGGIPGELEHPTTMNITLENVSHKITDISIDEKGVVTGSITLLNTPKGQIAQAIVEGGLPLFVSSRATGEIQEGKVKLSKIFTYDLVGTPGFSQARVKLNENQHIDMLNENICVLSEEDENMEKNIKEALEWDARNLKNPNYHNLKYKQLYDDGEENEETSDYWDAFFMATENSKDDWYLSGFGVATNKKKDDSLAIVLDNMGDSMLSFDYGEWKDDNPVAKNIKDIYFVKADPKNKSKIRIEIVGADDITKIEKKYNCTFSFDPSTGVEVVDGDPLENKNISMDEIKALIKESEKRTEKFIMEQVAPGIEDWIINDYSPELEKYMVEHFAPEIEHWVVNEFAPEIEKWVTESFAGTLENWVNEELTPELIGKIKGEVNEQLKNTKESRLDSIKETIALLENISPNSPNFQPASSIINENSQDEPIYIREMPKELRPKYNMASQAVKENLARRAKLYDFTVEGALERFWSSFDSIVESFQNQPTVNQPIILDSKEQSIREALRKRFKR